MNSATSIEEDKAYRIFDQDLKTILASGAHHGSYRDIIGPLGYAPDDIISFALRSLERAKNIDLKSPNLIPFISHRIWLTDPNSWSLPPENYLQSIAKTIAGQGAEWRHMFWTNVEGVAEAVRKYFADANIKVRVANITSEFLESPLLKPLNRLVEHRKFVFAADFAKTMTLLKFGGVYSDLGVDYDPIVAEWAVCCSEAVVVDGSLIFQLSFLAMPPSALTLRIWQEILIHPDILTAALRGRDYRFSASEEVSLLSGPGFTSIFMMQLERGRDYLAVPYQSRLFRWSSQKSWYGTPKFGNVVIRDTAPSVIDHDAHDQRSQGLASACVVVGSGQQLASRLRLLISLGDLFRDIETPLCGLLNKAGSDKARGWHNYAYVYHYFLRDYIGQRPRLLEIGIGTNFTDVPSSMGPNGRPGASLRAWRSYFGNGQVVGADVDRRILFREENIETYFVDQLSRDTLIELGSRLSQDGGVDIIIDDGLHTFDANINTFESLFGSVRPKGIFIVEDVVYVAIPKWKSYFEQNNLNACIVRPENPKNPRDNCFIFVLPSVQD